MKLKAKEKVGPQSSPVGRMSLGACGTGNDRVHAIGPLVSYLVNWRFEPSQPLGIISGLKVSLFLVSCCFEPSQPQRVNIRAIRAKRDFHKEISS